MHARTSYELARHYREAGLPSIAAFLEHNGDRVNGSIVFDVTYVDPSSPIVEAAATAVLSIADPYEYFYSLFIIEVPDNMVPDIGMGLALLELCCNDYLEAQGPRHVH
jgi:hypothetical protein